MATPTTAWPDYFPKDCPPPDAHRDTIVVYRAVRNNPPTEQDFLSYMIAGTPYYDDECRACGLSVFSSIDAIINKRKQIPGFRKRYSLVAMGTLDTDSGLLQSTGDQNHITWWVEPGSVPHTLFAVVVEL